MKDEDITDWIIDREECSGYSFEKEKKPDEMFEELGYEKINEICFIPSVPKSKKDEEKIKIKMEVTVMSKADEMFEELGYEKINDDEYGIIYEKGTSIRNRIVFKRANKTVYCILIDEDYEWNDAMAIDMQELKAINKKCQELGWIE